MGVNYRAHVIALIPMFSPLKTSVISNPYPEGGNAGVEEIERHLGFVIAHVEEREGVFVVSEHLHQNFAAVVPGVSRRNKGRTHVGILVYRDQILIRQQRFAASDILRTSQPIASGAEYMHQRTNCIL